MLFFSKNNQSGRRGKHIDIKYLRVRDNIKRHEVFIEHISTGLMIVDLMTKGLPVKLFKSHVEHMGLIDSFYLVLIFVYIHQVIVIKFCAHLLLYP